MEISGFLISLMHENQELSSKQTLVLAYAANKRTCSCNNCNFEVLKLQFAALSSPIPKVLEQDLSPSHGITVKTIPIPVALPQYLR